VTQRGRRDRIAGTADPSAGEVLQALESLMGGAKDPISPAVGEAYPADPMRKQVCHQLRADRPIQHAHSMPMIFEEERQLKSPDPLIEIPERTQIRVGHVDIACGKSFDRLHQTDGLPASSREIFTRRQGFDKDLSSRLLMHRADHPFSGPFEDGRRVVREEPTHRIARPRPCG